MPTLNRLRAARDAFTLTEPAIWRDAVFLTHAQIRNAGTQKLSHYRYRYARRALALCPEPATMSDGEADSGQINGVASSSDRAESPLEPSTPVDSGPQAQPASSQVTLPSTEIPGSPIDPNQSFKTEAIDDRAVTTVIPSSLTPPPSTQVAAHNNGRRTFSQSQQSALCSPPATILQHIRDRDVGTDYVPPAPQQVLDATADDLRAMLQTCIAEQQKLKMETAHHKLQFNLLSLQTEDDAKRAVVEHDMIRREVDALRMAEHSREARRELSSGSDSSQHKYLQMKAWYEAAVEENETLHRRLKAAKKVIQQKEEETVSLAEERDLLLTRIRENREHFHMLCSPGGIFHSAMTPRHQQQVSTPQRYRSSQAQHTPRASQRDEHDGREHGISALLQAMSQSQENNNSNNSAPSTPMTSHRAVQRHTSRHSRNAQSMSSLPATPANRARDSGLLPSANLVPQTEPRQRYSQHYFAPTTPTPRRNRRRESRESTISADEGLEPVDPLQSFASHASRAARAPEPRSRTDQEDDDVFDSQASRAATEMLRRHPGKSFEATSPVGSRGSSPAVDKSAALQARLMTSGTDKRKFSGGADANASIQGSPPKRMRVGLGIQYE